MLENLVNAERKLQGRNDLVPENLADDLLEVSTSKLDGDHIACSFLFDDKGHGWQVALWPGRNESARAR